MGQLISSGKPIDQQIKKGIEKFPQYFPFNNPRMLAFIKENCFEFEWIFEFKSIFDELSQRMNGYINKREFLTLVNESSSSSMTLYSDYLFEMCEKELSDNMNFFEFIKCVVHFGILDAKSLIMFVFRLIDQDKDEIITLKDIHDFVSMKSAQKHYFPPNLKTLIENIQINEEFIDFEVFWRYKDILDFVIYPAFLLQEKIHKNIIGSAFWKRFYEKTQRKAPRQVHRRSKTQTD